VTLCGLEYYTRMPWNRFQQHVLFSHSVPTEPLSPTALDWQNAEQLNSVTARHLCPSQPRYSCQKSYSRTVCLDSKDTRVVSFSCLVGADTTLLDAMFSRL
jgi:hypothetical protein